MNEALKQACTANPYIDISFDFKFRYTQENAKTLFDIIDASPCSCKTKNFLFNTPYPNDAEGFKNMIKGRRCQGYMVLYFHPGTVPIGVAFWLQTRFVLGFEGVDCLSFDFSIWDK